MTNPPAAEEQKPVKTRRRWPWVLTAVVLAAAAAGAVAFDPAARIQGWVGGEPFYQGKSATAWRRELGTRDETARSAAVKSLVDGKATDLCGWLLARAPEADARSAAADALRQMGKDAAPAGPALVAAVTDPDPLVRAVATRAVGGLAADSPAAVPGAVPALVNQFPDVEAIRAVAGFKEAGAEALPELVKLFRHDDLVVRLQAMRSAGKVGEPAKSLLPVFVAAMAGDENSRVRERAAEVIGYFGPGAAEAVPALVKALKDPDGRVRRDAVRSLGQVGPAARPALAEVRAMQTDPEEIVRSAAAHAVRLLDPAAAPAPKP